MHQLVYHHAESKITEAILLLLHEIDSTRDLSHIYIEATELIQPGSYRSHVMTYIRKENAAQAKTAAIQLLIPLLTSSYLLTILNEIPQIYNRNRQRHDEHPYMNLTLEQIINLEGLDRSADVNYNEGDSEPWPHRTKEELDYELNQLHLRQPYV